MRELRLGEDNAVRGGKREEYGDKAKMATRLTDIGAQEHLEKRANKIVDPLNVSRRRMPYRPDIQYPLEALAGRSLQPSPPCLMIQTDALGYQAAP